MYVLAGAAHFDVEAKLWRTPNSLKLISPFLIVAVSQSKDNSSLVSAYHLRSYEHKFLPHEPVVIVRFQFISFSILYCAIIQNKYQLLNSRYSKLFKRWNDLCSPSFPENAKRPWPGFVCFQHCHVFYLFCRVGTPTCAFSVNGPRS